MTSPCGHDLSLWYILAHDFKNHLAFIRTLDNAEEKDEYIDKISPKIESFSNAGISKNKTLDIIISKYSSLCDIKGISFKIDVKTSNLNQIDSFDLVTLLNNLLDNALEAAEISEAKSVELFINEHTRFYDRIVIKNSADEKPQHDNKALQTSKWDKALHGIGLKSVKKIVKKYNGMYDWYYDESEHIFTTIINLQKELAAK